VIGNGDAYLRAGPRVIGFEDVPAAEPPYGIGSLGLRTDSGEDKATFGNQVDFLGDEFGIAQLGYWVYTTAENRDAALDNLPNIQFEINANLDAIPGAVDFTTATYVLKTNCRDGTRSMPLSTASGSSPGRRAQPRAVTRPRHAPGMGSRKRFRPPRSSLSCSTRGVTTPSREP
jgi:hypothetical protein